MDWIKDKLNDLLADVKRAYVSLTIWVNGVVLTIISILPLAQDYFPQMQEYLSPSFYKAAMGAIVFINIILRFKTTTALRDK
jgi:hypothetical protein